MSAQRDVGKYEFAIKQQYLRVHFFKMSFNANRSRNGFSQVKLIAMNFQNRMCGRIRNKDLSNISKLPFLFYSCFD